MLNLKQRQATRTANTRSFTMSTSTASTVTPAITLAAIKALVSVIEQIAATAVLDVEDPLNLLNFSADLQLVTNIKTAVVDAKTVIADLSGSGKTASPVPTTVAGTAASVTSVLAPDIPVVTTASTAPATVSTTPTTAPHENLVEKIAGDVAHIAEKL